MAAAETPVETFKRALAHAARALAEQAELEVRFGGDGPKLSSGVLTLPHPPRDPAAPVGTAANPVTVGGNMTPPPTEAKAYPVCGKGVQDGCVNPGEAKKRMRRPG
ncbi:hypothetical protein [Brevundimonas sp. UBA5936]|uniref:hypothetical protein n=1 Tax=Brevundimonas sp. UBA5936 TaxID=1946133 RepID=UPI0039C8B767